MPRTMSVALSMGIPVLAGTNTGVTGALLGISSQIELVLLVDAGLTSAEALASGRRGTWTWSTATWLRIRHPSPQSPRASDPGLFLLKTSSDCSEHVFQDKAPQLAGLGGSAIGISVSGRESRRDQQRGGGGANRIPLPHSSDPPTAGRCGQPRGGVRGEVPGKQDYGS